ncbi:hypothetical protein AKJ09_02744 [Labilithrix luteola]|uniref:Glycosyltransferase RgtA/B/C/D-like domain-containing protein n=1 Tax=Labilithrix luteola TaxID=1391654 RepID=A0A0K1PRB1_9BACT|nr:hypothetical protein [Labilithrix luteola]AKU96080.1 hypothetical protein AKJ09_02744 [Labilithrix luteola]
MTKPRQAPAEDALQAPAGALEESREPSSTKSTSGGVERVGSYSLAATTLALSIGMLVQRFSQLWPWVVDDSYITLRYARHLANGEGLRWNPNETPVEGFTSFFWVVLTAVPHALGTDAVAFAKVVSLLLVGASAAFSASLSWQWLPANTALRFAASVAAAVLVCASPMTAIHSASGMETALFTALVVGFANLATLFTNAPSRTLAWALSSLCLLLGLARPEGNVLALVVVASALLGSGASAATPETRRAMLTWPLLVGYILPGTVYFIARWRFFGLPLPLPFFIKAAAGWEGIDEVVGFYRQGVGWLGILALVGFISFRRSWPLALALVIHSLFYLKPAHLMGFSHRYLFPYFPLVAAAAVLGVARLLRSHPRAAAYAVLGAAVMASCAWLSDAQSDIASQLAYARGLDHAHVRLGHDLKGLASQAGAPLRLVISDAGAVPYFSDWLTLDSFGLNDLEIARTGKREVDYIYRDNPDAVVVLSHERERFVPRLSWEEPIGRAAMARGYGVGGIYEFGAPEEPPFGGYYLWVLTRPGLPALTK